jgi:hypothetical protein
MSKPNKKVYRLSQVVTEVREKHPDIVIELDEGEPIRILPPQLWPDAVTKLGADNLAVAQELMGDRYSDFIAGGGTIGVFGEIIGDATGDGDLGESSAS